MVYPWMAFLNYLFFDFCVYTLQTTDDSIDHLLVS